MQKFYKKMLTYFAKHSNYNAYVHFLGGIGVGFLLAYPVTGIHPVRWGLFFLGLSLTGHIWAGYKK